MFVYTTLCLYTQICVCSRGSGSPLFCYSVMRVYREAYTLVLTFSEILAGKFESWPLTNASKQKDVEEFAQARKHTHTRTHTHTHTHSLTHSLTHLHTYLLTYSLTHTIILILSPQPGYHPLCTHPKAPMGQSESRRGPSIQLCMASTSRKCGILEKSRSAW